ncbi:triose-phosphate isomerase [Patescibacteria group bacterium]|nr:triose-phosphate isomerase [Patescibacteria group bacterium]MBU4452916.1 triose-phosphate isomerase [Patescibacteria group bacterium]MCG2687756.1 triose-phosphate isomerase [Candidatus Parcubacteria bacterium]
MKYIFANWKMHLGIRESVALARAVMQTLRGEDDMPQVVIFPSFTVLNDVRKVMARSRMKLGAQNCGTEKKGAFTGEVSAHMLEDVGCQYALVGHSERRIIFSETNEIVAKRYKTVLLESKITPVLCVGETLVERQADNAQGYVSEQIVSVFNGVRIPRQKEVFIAYEPVWAIGASQPASVADVVSMHSFIKELVKKLTDVADNRIHILYGGSIDAKNVYAFLREKQVDGVLVGGASLKVKDFELIVKSATDVITAQEL